MNALLDRVDFRCTSCGELMRTGCDCWVELRCPRCNRMQKTERIDGDPSGDYLEALCPDCTSPKENDSR